jgi:hypothetical protein
VCKGDNEEHEKATTPIARSESYPQPEGGHTSPCLSAMYGVRKLKSREADGERPIYDRCTRRGILTEEVVVTTVAAVDAASGCLWVMMHFCVPETVSTVAVVRRGREVRRPAGAKGSLHSPQTSCGYLVMHLVRAWTWGMRSLRYRESSRGTEASGKPNRRSAECQRAPMSGNLLAT